MSRSPGGTVQGIIRCCVSLVGCVLLGCGWMRHGIDAQGASPEAALGQILSEWGGIDSVTVLGFRDHWGKSPEGTDILNTALLSALGRLGTVVNPDAGIALADPPTMKYRNGQVLPTQWRELTGEAVPRGQILAGQIRKSDRWTYLRLSLADAATGDLRAHGSTRISQTELDRLVAAATQDSVFTLQPLDVDYHVVVRRDDTGFAQMVEVEEGATLIEGDRLQIRLKSKQDCEVFAFLYASDGGARENLLDPQRIYKGRWNYGPSENGWTTLSDGDEVFTLYLMIAPKIDEDRTTLWERLAELQSQAQIERMNGLDLVDGALADFLQRTIAVTDSAGVLRGADQIELAEDSESFAYQDGTVFEHRGEKLSGVVILRALSFHVRWK